MAYGDIYAVGTISVSTGDTSVTGVGTTWHDGPNPMLPGDTLDADGCQQRILSVDSNTSLTLAVPFSGATLSDAPYAIYFNSVQRNTPAAAIQRLNSYLDGIARLKDAVDIWKCVEVGLNTQPVSPSEGDLYVVGTAPTGADWTGHDNEFAKRLSSGWKFTAPSAGDIAEDMSAGTLWFFNSDGDWIERSLGTGAVRYDAGQSLSSGEQAQAIANIGAVASTNVIRTDTSQSLSDGQKSQAASNGALSLALDTATLPTSDCGPVLTLLQPHLRQFVWNGTAYVRAPWHRPGLVLYSYVDTVPAGWLEVRSDVSYAQANYPDLASLLGVSVGANFSLIEARGEFIRVWDHGRNADTGRAIRSWQDGTYVAIGFNSIVATPQPGGNNGDGGVVGGANYLDTSNGISLSFSRTRPRNVALPLLISY